MEYKTKWRCTLCGFMYEGDSIPEDFVRPVCQDHADQFIKTTK